MLNFITWSWQYGLTSEISTDVGIGLESDSFDLQYVSQVHLQLGNVKLVL